MRPLQPVDALLLGLRRLRGAVRHCRHRALADGRTARRTMLKSAGRPRAPKNTRLRSRKLPATTQAGSRADIFDTVFARLILKGSPAAWSAAEIRLSRCMSA